MTTMSSLFARLSRWFAGRKVNAKSRTLSGPEAIAFRARMEAHGMDDDDSRSIEPMKTKAR